MGPIEQKPLSDDEVAKRESAEIARKAEQPRDWPPDQRPVEPKKEPGEG